LITNSILGTKPPPFTSLRREGGNNLETWG
jgi:hypothetical protein